MGRGDGQEGEGRLERREGGRGGTDKISVSVCLSAGCGRRVSWACSPDPHPPSPSQPLSPQSVMDGWFGEGGGARPVSSAPQRPPLLGLHWGLLLLNYGEGLPSDRSLAGSSDGGASAQPPMCDPLAVASAGVHAVWIPYIALTHKGRHVQVHALKHTHTHTLRWQRNAPFIVIWLSAGITRALREGGSK